MTFGLRAAAIIAFWIIVVISWVAFLLFVVGVTPHAYNPDVPRSGLEKTAIAVAMWGSVPAMALGFVFYRRLLDKILPRDE